MNELERLRQQVAELEQGTLAILEAADEDDRDLTEEEQTKVDANTAKIKEISAKIQRKEAINERRRNMQATPTPTPRAEVVNEPNPATTDGFKSLGEFAVAVHGAVQFGRIGTGEVDPRLAAPTGTHMGGGSAGEGYMLPPQFRDEIWELVTQFDDFGPLIDEEPTERREVKLGVDETTPWGAAGVQAYWRAEGSQMTPSKLATEGRSVPLHELYTLVLATDELLEDAARVNNRLTRGAARAIGWKKNLAIVEGNGVGQPLGWMKSPALITVPKESGQAADTLNANNILKMYKRQHMVPGGQPFWLIHQSSIEQLMTMTIGDRPIWMAPNGLQAAPGGTLLGLPVRFSEFASELGDRGDIQLIEPRGYYGVRRAQGPKFASSIHLYFDYNVEAFRWVFRYGGQPHLSKPVSPAKGSETRSHFITLAERA